MTIPLGTAVPHDLVHASPSALAGVLYLGLVVTTVPLVLWTWVLSNVAASAASAMLLLIGPSAVLASWLVLGEAPGALALVGGAVTLGGVAVAQLAPARPSRPAVGRPRRGRHPAAQAAA